MNFPHKLHGTDGEEKRAVSHDALSCGNHRLLIADIIAQQALSHSARTYESLRKAGGVELGQALWMEDRIRYFAGETDVGQQIGEEANLFVRGHFRPDRVQTTNAGELSGRIYERAVYLGDLAN